MRAIERNTRYSSYSNALTSYSTTRMRKELEYQAFLKEYDKCKRIDYYEKIIKVQRILWQC